MTIIAAYPIAPTSLLSKQFYQKTLYSESAHVV